MTEIFERPAPKDWLEATAKDTIEKTILNLFLLLRDGAGNVYIEKLPIARIQQLESLLALNKVKTEAYFIRIPQDEVNATVFFDKLGIIARPLK
jgi:hypothetical protein